MARLVTTLALIITSADALAWSEGGHQLIADLAYGEISSRAQAELLRLLPEHPRYEEDFRVPPKVKDAERYRIGRLGYWPVLARSQPKYHRPKWHYQPGATLVVGEVGNVPEGLYDLPTEATLETQDLYAVQAMKLCYRVLSDPEQPDADRAIALSWLTYLIGVIHQPCHAGSLYAETVFPEGDRYANEIAVKQGRNLHQIWDELIGRRFDEQQLEQQLERFYQDSTTFTAVRELPFPRHPEYMVAGSRHEALKFVYAQEVLKHVEAASEGRSESLPALELSEDYLDQADSCARKRIQIAAAQLAAIWAAALDPSRLNRLPKRW